MQTPAEELPDEKEIKSHEVTHLPFRNWCSICVRTKSREDRTVQNADFEKENTGIPTIQLDWCFLGRNCPALVMIDSSTRYGCVSPTASKAAFRTAADGAISFSLELGHVSEVTFVMDAEPTAISLLDLIVEIRSAMKYPTSKKIGKPYHKGRTARVERYIQSVKRQAAALVVQVEDRIQTPLADVHCLRAWALVHSSFLLNRFHEHAALKGTPYEIVFGKKYDGKLLPFGEFVFGLRQPAKKQGTSVWSGGIWVGKNAADMNVLVTASGQFQTRSVRRCSAPWRRDAVLALTSTPWTKEKALKIHGGLGAPLPAVVEHSTEELKEGQIGVDEEADAVRDYVTPPSTPSIGEMAPITPELLRDEGLRPTQAEKEASDSSMAESSGILGGKREVEEVNESLDQQAAKVPRVDGPSSSPSSPSRLYKPFFAGQVEMKPHDDELWENDVEQELGLDEQMLSFFEQTSEVDFWGERPPEVSESELARLDSEAMLAEVGKLESLDVVEPVRTSQVDLENVKFVDLTEVFDWRFRENQWRRRCHIVAREFRMGQTSDAETFSPTSAVSAIRCFFLFHLCFHWKLMSLDISDAYLTVAQVEPCYVELRPWIKSLLNLPDDTLWRLKKVLPGQRNGAKRWFSSFSSVLLSIGFEACEVMPSIFKHKTRDIIMNVHVDDELVAMKDPADGEWLLTELRKKYKLQVEGPVPIGRFGKGEELNYLKKTYIFSQEGILVRPNGKYVSALLDLYNLEGRKAKATPDHALLNQVDLSESLADISEERKQRFRSGFGTLMYLAQDRTDCQYAIKCLSSWLANPTEQGEKCLTHLILYLSGTRNMTFLLPYEKPGAEMIKKINGQQNDNEESEHCLEIFCDSDWAGNVSTRKSTSSCMIFINSIIFWFTAILERRSQFP